MPDKVLISDVRLERHYGNIVFPHRAELDCERVPFLVHDGFLHGLSIHSNAQAGEVDFDARGEAAVGYHGVAQGPVGRASRDRVRKRVSHLRGFRARLLLKRGVR